MNRKIAILTSGGDSPGMNNVIRSVVKYGLVNNIEVFLIYEGYKGLVENKIISSKNVNVDQHIAKGGTFIKTARYLPFKSEENIRLKAVDNLKKFGIDSLIVIGGDGSYAGAQALHELGVKTIAIPGTIDNDIASTNYTVGFDTALNTIVENIDKVRDTMNSMQRVALVEVMGHGAGDLALYSSLATGAEIIVTNQHKLSVEEMAEIINDQIKIKNKESVIAIISEFIFDDIKDVALKLKKITNVETRGMSFSHIQRGGIPTALERFRASKLGIKAIDFLIEGKSGIALGYIDNKIQATPIPEALKRKNGKLDKEISDAIIYNKINQA